MRLFKKKHAETNEKNLSYVFKCDEISDINELVVGSLFNVTVSDETNDAIISIARVYENDLVSSFTTEEHNGTYKTAKLSVTLSGRVESTGKDVAEVILPKSKLNLDRVILSGAANMVGGHFNRISVKIIVSGAAQLTTTVDTDKMELNTSGTSTVILDGSIKTLVIDASGSSNVYAGDIYNRNAVVDAGGAARVLIDPSDSATGRASGAAKIIYPICVRYENIKTNGIAEKQGI